MEFPKRMTTEDIKISSVDKYAPHPVHNTIEYDHWGLGTRPAWRVWKGYSLVEVEEDIKAARKHLHFYNLKPLRHAP